MIDFKVTPNMIRLIIREKNRLITGEEAGMFMTLFREQIEDALRQALKETVRSHYE